MPNRVVRQDILTSEPVNTLSWAGEVFYRRLMSVVDDYGRYDGRASVIRSSIYPLKLDQVSQTDVIKWMNECSEAGLVSLYEVDNKPYLELLKFGQTIRIKKEKYPANICSQMLADVSRCMSGTKPNQTETETGVGIATTTFFFKIRGNIVLEKLSDYFPKNFAIFLDSWQMRNDKAKTITKKILIEMDTSYAGYSFTDENHLQKSFEFTYIKKIKPELDLTPKQTVKW